MQLEPGQEYWWCACGRSSDQPFCDSSHAGTDFEPIPFEVEEARNYALCTCKRTGNAPFCDGSHAKVPADRVGKEFALGTAATPDAMPEASPTPEEPTVAFIHQLATEGLSKIGHHGPMAAMGVPRSELPGWDDIQIMVAQLARKPLMEDVPVGTELIIGPDAKKPLRLEKAEKEVESDKHQDAE